MGKPILNEAQEEISWERAVDVISASWVTLTIIPSPVHKYLSSATAYMQILGSCLICERFNVGLRTIQSAPKHSGYLMTSHQRSVKSFLHSVYFPLDDDFKDSIQYNCTSGLKKKKLTEIVK